MEEREEMLIDNMLEYRVNFPFHAYDCEIVYMERVVEVLQQIQQNALLESPTTTK